METEASELIRGSATAVTKLEATVPLVFVSYQKVLLDA